MTAAMLPVFTVYVYDNHFELESDNVIHAIKLEILNMSAIKVVSLDVRELPLFRNVIEANALNCRIVNAQNLQDKLPKLKHLVCYDASAKGMVSHPELQSLYVFDENADGLQLNMPSLRNLSANVEAITPVTKQVHNLICRSVNMDRFRSLINVKYLSFSVDVNDDVLREIVGTFRDLTRLCLLRANISKQQLMMLSQSSIRTLYLHRSSLVSGKLILDAGLEMYELIQVDWLKEATGYNVFIFDGKECLDLTQIPSA